VRGGHHRDRDRPPPRRAGDRGGYLAALLERAEANARAAGVAGLDTETGPFEMMTPRGFLADEGLPRCLAIMGQVAGRPAYARKMAWLMPCMAKAVPYLGYVLVAGTKPA